MPIRRRYRKISKRPRRSYKRTARKVSPIVKKYVKRAIANHAENKFTIVRALNQAIPTVSGTTPFAFSILPSLQSGSARYQRNSNSVRIKNLSVNIRVNMLPYNATTNPQPYPVAVKFYLLSVAPFREIGAFSGSPAATGFYEGETGPIGPTGSVQDLLLPVSQDFKVYATKTVILGATSGTTTWPSTLNNTSFDNSKFSQSVYFNPSKHLKSALKYNDTVSSSIPENRNMWVAAIATSLDGSSLGVTPCECHYVVKTTFEDM